MTVIAFIGCVFSPSYARARRRGAADPLDHCAFNVALYGERGRRWCLTEYGSSRLVRDACHLAIGPNAFAWDGGALVLDIDETAAPLPFPVRGRVRVIPEAIGDRLFPLDGRRLHRWWPTAPRCRIEVAMERPALRWRGTGYHDTNAGDRALEDDFARWDWSRGASRDGGIVLYDVEGRERTTTIAVRVDRTGRSHDFAPPARTALPRTLWGLERKARSEDASGPRVAETLEDTPFYARSVVSARLLGESVTSVHESLSLDRFRTAWVQTLLPFRMRRAR